MTSLFNIPFLSILFFTIIQKDNLRSGYLSTSISSNIYISQWENNKYWNTGTEEDQKGYYLKRSIPQLTEDVLNNGVVMVFTKGYSFTESNLQEKPLQMPFYFFPSNGSPNGACKWLIIKTLGEIELGIKMPEEVEPSFKQSQMNVQLRYFLFEEAFLKKHKLSKKVLQNMSYQQVVNLLDIAS